MTAKRKTRTSVATQQDVETASLAVQDLPEVGQVTNSTPAGGSGIAEAWTFIEFCKLRGALPRIYTYTQKSTGEAFQMLCFPRGFQVSLSKRVRDLDKETLLSKVDDLQIVRLNSGVYKLCLCEMKENNTFIDKSEWGFTLDEVTSPKVSTPTEEEFDDDNLPF